MEVEGLLNRAEQIRDEKKDGANTAQRVGGLMVDIVKSFGNQSLEILGHYDTLEELKQAYPEGPNDNGMYAVGEKPYSYYAYYDGDWQDQGKLVEELTVYKSSISLSTIINEGSVTQDHLTEINSIYAAWKSGRMVYVLDEKGGYYNLGVLNMQLAEDNSKCSFVALDQSGVLCYYSCNPSSGVTGKWSVTPIGKDLFAMIEHTHIASDITEVINRRFMTDEQKTKLDDIDLSQYAKSDLSNAVTTLTSGNNTYIKFNNGILIQYGRITTTGQKERRVYMPMSFKNDGYKVFYGIEAGADVVQTLYTLNKSTSSFYVSGTFYDPYNGNKGFPGEAFDWFAIGIWK